MNLHKVAGNAGIACLLVLASGCTTLQNMEQALSGPDPIGPSPVEDVAAIDAQLAASPQRPVTPSAPPITSMPVLPDPATLGPPGKPRIIAKVESVQFPAWIERGGVRASIKAGWALFTGDTIFTGGEGRIVLGVAGDGQLKIGGNAQLTFTPAYNRAVGAPEPPLLTVDRGPFQYSSPPVRSASDAGSTLVIGRGIYVSVLGGHVYGNADNREDMLLLLTGAARVWGPKLHPGTMTRPDTWLRVPNVGRASPVGPANPERIARWVGSTEIVRGKPTLQAGGVWDVSLNSGYNLKQLETMACRIQTRGYPSEIYPVREPGKQVWYRVLVRRFASKEDAVRFLGTAKALGSNEPWVLLPQS